MGNQLPASRELILSVYNLVLGPGPRTAAAPVTAEYICTRDEIKPLLKQGYRLADFKDKLDPNGLDRTVFVRLELP